MVEKKPRVLICEDRKRDAKEIEQYLRSDCIVDLVYDTDEAVRKISPTYDCYAFDVNVPGRLLGHQVLMEAIDEGHIRVSCIAMTGIDNIKILRDSYEHYFVDFVDKRQSKWIVDLGSKIIRWSKADPRGNYMRKRFTKLQAMDNPVLNQEVSSSGLAIGASKTAAFCIKNLVEMLEVADTPESEKNRIYDLLNRKLKKLL